MEHVLFSLRTHVDVLVEAADSSSSRRPRVGKIERLKAVNAIKDALSRKSTIAALTAASTLEMVRGPQEDPRAATPPLSWAELTAVLVETLDQTCNEALNSRFTSKTGNLNLKLDYIICFRLVLKLAMAHGPSGVLRPIVPAFLYFAPQWLSEPPLRVLMADHVWQCVRDILHDDANRAMLTPPYIRSWVDICVEQLTGRGPLKYASPVVSKLAADVLETIARGVDNYDIHTQSTKALPPSKMSGGDYGYAVICERCCVMLVMSESMSSRDARELQAVAFRTMTIALSEHALDVIGGSALKSIINVSLKPMLSCWTNRIHHDSAVALASLLLRLDPTHKKLTALCRQRLLNDMRDESSSAVVRAGHQVKDHFIDALASCVSFGESLQFAASSDAGQGQIIVWLRVAHAIISRRVLKIGTSLLIDCADVMDQCTAAADAITIVFRTQKDIREGMYSEVARWSTKVIDSTAVVANRIHTEVKRACPAAVEAWQKLYVVLREQLIKVSFSIRSKTAQFRTNGEAIHADVHLLQTASLLCTLDILDPSVLRHTSQHAETHRSNPYPLSKIASSQGNLSALEVGYLRNLLARCGMQDRDGGYLRLRLIHSLAGICGLPLPAGDRTSRMLIDGSSAASGLARGECTVRHQMSSQEFKDTYRDFSSQDLCSQAFYSFQKYFGQSAGMTRISVDGARLVKRLKDQSSVFGDALNSFRPASALATSEGSFRTDSLRKSARLKSVKSAHFSVDSVVTETIESQILEKLSELAEDINFEEDNCTRGHDGGSAVGEDSVQKHSVSCRFGDDNSCSIASRIIIFIGNYLLEGLSCSTISLSERSPDNEQSACTGLVMFLAKLVSAHAATDATIVVGLNQLSHGVIQVSSRLCNMIKLKQSKTQGTTCVLPEWFELLRVLSNSLAILSQNLCTLLMNMLSVRTRQSIGKVQTYVTGRLVSNEPRKRRSAKRKRSLSDHTQGETVKKRRFSPLFSPSGSVESRGTDTKNGDKMTGFEDENLNADSDGSLSDEFEDEFLRTLTKKENNSFYCLSRGKEKSQRQMWNASKMLRWLINEFPDITDDVVDTCLKSIEGDEEAGRALSPDGFERPALASSLVDNLYTESRECLWAVLIAMRTPRALEALGRDILKSGTHWKDLERVSHSYDSFYVESLRVTNNNRKHYPMLKFLERMRVSFLKYARQFLELCLPRNESGDVKGGAAPLQLNPRTILFLVNGLIDVSEHFRLKHAFRMPRVTRITYLEFGLTAVKLINEKLVDASCSLDSDSLQSLPLREALQAIQSASCKLLADSEAVVRLAAASVAPALLATFSNRPLSQIEILLQDSIPQIASCEESTAFCGKNLGIQPNETVEEGNLGIAFEMSEDERIASSFICESFRTVGAQAKAFMALVALGEVANTREDLIPFCVVQILFRVMRGIGSLAAAYQILAKVCASRGYSSPAHLYKSFSRIILPKWFKTSQNATLLHQIPGPLLVDKNHHADTVLYDWMRDEQSNLLPHFLVSDEAPCFPQTTEFANMLGMDLETLLLSNVGPFSLVFPMQFMRNLHERGKSLWEAIDAVLGNQSQELMFKHKSDVMAYFLRNVSSGTHNDDHWSGGTFNLSEELGFSRDTTVVEPPFYDPLVVACAINQLFDFEPNVFIVPKSVLRGPLFAEVRDEQTGSAIADEFKGFITECHRGKISLLRMLLTVSRLLLGPPVPQPSQNHLDGFFCVGMLWRMLGVNVLVKSSLERVMFYHLVAKGFERSETMRDAAWLLLEVQSKVVSMYQTFPDVNTDFSDLNVSPSKREHLLCMNSRQERQMYELLNAVSPVLISIVSSTKPQSDESLKTNASESLCKLLQLCHQKALWTVILCNGPLPNLRHLSDCRNLYNSSRSMIEVDTPDRGAAKLLSSLERFQGIYRSRNGSQYVTAMLACLQEISTLLTDSAVASLSQRIFQEAWLRSDGQDQPTALHIRRSISYLINLVYETGVRLGNAPRTVSESPEYCLCEDEKNTLLSRLIHEVGNVMSVLGLIHPPSIIYIGNSSLHTSIPSLSESGKYENVESGIERCLLSLVDILRGPSAIAAETALSTLLNLLRSEDGKRVFGKEKDKLSLVSPIRSAARKLGTDKSESVSVEDCFTGEDILTKSFPKLYDTQLWSMDKDDQLELSYGRWMKRLCFVLCSSCDSGAFKAMSSACLLSYELSCELFPYLLMNIVARLDAERLLKLSQLILDQILTNSSTPTQILRTFVHALDVLCQTGFGVIYHEGISHWVDKADGLLIPRFRYVLGIPYNQAAKAALRSGSYFSVIRFAQMHVDQAVSVDQLNFSEREQRAEKRHSSSLQRTASSEASEQAAKQDVTDLVKEAMIRINEPDGVRAFGYAENLPKLVSDLANLDGDWAKSLGALDILGRFVGTTNYVGDHEFARIAGDPPIQGEHRFVDMRREISLMRSLIGLGAPSVATRYWDGLQMKISRAGVNAKSPVADYGSLAEEELIDLRHALAWKLGEWESPSMLPDSNLAIGDRRRIIGFHESVFRVLQAFQTERWAEVSPILAHSRKLELHSLVRDSAGASAVSIFQTSARLRLFQLLEDVQRQNSPLSIRQNDLSPNLAASALAALPREDGSAPRDVDPPGREPYVDLRYQKLGRGEPDGDVINKILQGHLRLEENHVCREVSIYADAFDDSILAEDLPIALVQSLSRKRDIARAAAAVSMQIFAKGGTGSWARSASCLGTAYSAMLANACEGDRVAWKLQESRLRWFASHDASSKKQALSAVKDIITKSLGGCTIERRSTSPLDSASSQPALVWETDHRNSDHRAYLRSEACIMAANWSLDMRTHEPISLFDTFLEAGLRAVELANAKDLTGRAHFAMASFADAQITNIDSYRKTRKYTQMLSSIRESEYQIEKLQTIQNDRKITSKGSGRRSSRLRLSQLGSGGITEKIGKDLDSFIREEQKKTLQDRTRLVRMEETYQRWQILACKHFAACLREGNTHDLRAAFRMIAIWLDSGQVRDTITEVLTMTKGNECDTDKPFKLSVPSVKLLPLAPQLSSRLGPSNGLGNVLFHKALSHTIYQMAEEYPAYCLWQLLALSNSTRLSATHEKYSSLYRGDKDKKDAADTILSSLEAKLGDIVREMRKVANAYICLSETSNKEKNTDVIDIKGSELVKLGELVHVPVPTMPLPLNGGLSASKLPHIVSFERRAGVCSGLSRPLRIVCFGSNGKKYPQMVKGRDDLRGDAVMEQLFTILNSLLEKDIEASKRSLLVRTYRIIPLSPFSGIMQFVSNTMQLKDVLVEREKSTATRGARKSLHERYRPNDLKHGEVSSSAFAYKKSHELPQRLKVLRKVWHRIQPVFHFFFLEQWPDPTEWFSHQQAYSRSVAVMSIVGFILGLGDRHLSNILLDVVTGEVVHIDFGIAFEQGRLLPTPEQMPFRLTRDIVDGFGIAGVEGVFRRCSEVALSVMRSNKDVLLTVVEVLLHDPMFNWDLAPEIVIREQLSLGGADREMLESEDLSKSLDDSAADAVVREVNKDIKGSSDAQRALNRISEKLDGLEGTERLSVEAHVARLIDEAQAFHVIASVYPGWAPWI